MNMKRFLSIALVAVMMFAMVGCSEETAENDTEEVAEEDTAVETVEDNEEEAELEEANPDNVYAKVIDIDLTDEEYAFGVDKDQPELLDQVNEFVGKIMEDGTLDEIFDSYFGEGDPEPVKSEELDESKDQLVVATNAEFEPFEYLVGEDYYGIDMEIASQLADYLGKELVIQNMSFDAVVLNVGEHKSDIAMAGLTVSESRKESVTFSTVYYGASQRIIVPSDDTTFDDCASAEDVENILKGMDDSVQIGVQQGTTGQFYIEGDEDLEFDGLPVTCVPYKNGSLAVQDMLNGNIQYVIIDAAPAERITANINELL